MGSRNRWWYVNPLKEEPAPSATPQPGAAPTRRVGGDARWNALGYAFSLVMAVEILALLLLNRH